MKKLIVSAIVFPLVLSSTAYAGILADLNQVVLANATVPTTMTTADRVGVMGGGFSMRMPVKQVNLVNFDPPRMNAGCGGVDLYGGSFSFINGQQLIQTFRAVASNAAGLFFKAAIKTISPSLDQLMGEFQTLMQNMNNLAKNSCSMAHLLVGDSKKASEKAISDQIDGDGNVGATNKGIFSDAISALQGYNADAKKFFKQTGEVNAGVGNTTMKAIIASGSSGILGLAGLGNLDGSTDDASNPNSLNNQLLISMVGYSVVGVPCSSTNQVGTTDGSSSVASNGLDRIVCNQPSTISMDLLIRGGGTGSTIPDTPLTLLKCTNPSGTAPSNGGFDPQICTSMQRTDFNYVGIRGWVNQMLFGSGDGLTVTNSSILGKFSSGSSMTFTQAQRQFIQQSGVPVMGLLSKTSDVHRLGVAIKLSTPVTDCISANFANAIYKALNGIRANNDFDLPKDVVANIDNIRKDAIRYSQLCYSDKSVLEVVQHLNAATSFRR